MAVLVAASPCALAISTPSAILSGVARAARAGLLVKGGSALEALGEVKTVAFDKTGTLTPGRPQLTDLVAADGVDEATLLAAAAAAEQQLGHPLARAVTAAARARLGPAFPPPAAAIENLPGLGVAAAMDGAPLLIGSEALLEAHGSAPAPALAARAAALRNAGRTVMFVHHAGRDLGLVAVMDEARPEAPAVLAALRGLGITRLVMLSGDSQAVAAAIATALGLSEVRGGLLPDDKVGAILALRAEAPVAMVGDGINDGPALASANVGIAMGAAGSDVALEAADVALMGDRLDALPFAVLLGRATRRTIRQNLAISLGMVAVLVPLTILGLRIGPAVAAHEGSTLLVVLNGLRLLRLRAPALASAAGSS
jgi:Cd2+/Zn2+-exporting ATPase